MIIPLKEISEQLKGEIIGDQGLIINGISSIEEAKVGEIAFVTHPKYEKKAVNTKASALMAREVLKGIEKTFLIVENPYVSFAELLSMFYPRKRFPQGIDPTANIGEGVRMGEGVSIGPSATLEGDVIIGNQVEIGAGVFIGQGSQIGDGSRIYPNVTIREGVQIGQRVIIHSGTVVGSDGFGFTYYRERYKKIPQVGGVIIEDDVEIGANVAIDRATLGFTIIGRGTKIDNLVQVGHNVKIGSHTILVSQVGISGSATIGDRVTLAGQVGVAGHLSIGDDVVVGGKSGVTKDISSGERVSGFPPISHNQWLRSQAAFRQLPEIRKQMIRLGRKMNQLEEALTPLKNKKGTS